MNQGFPNGQSLSIGGAMDRGTRPQASPQEMAGTADTIKYVKRGCFAPFARLPGFFLGAMGKLLYNFAEFRLLPCVFRECVELAGNQGLYQQVQNPAKRRQS
jgi:hypothetical protein